MEFVEDESFNAYIEKFKKLNLQDKKEITINEINRLLIFLDKLNREINENCKILLNREMAGIKKEGSTEDDFVEAVFVYINSIEEALANYVDNIENKIGGNNG